MKPMKTSYKEKSRSKRYKGDSTGAEKASAPTSKRRRSTQSKQTVVPSANTATSTKTIACAGCAKTDVPLMMGGRKFLFSFVL